MEAEGGSDEFPVHIPSKIRFSNDVEDKERSAIKCHFLTDTNCEIDLGILSDEHYYEVRFFMTHKLGPSVDIPAIQTPVVIVNELKKYEGRKGHRVTLEVKCGEKGFLDEQIIFENEKSEKVNLKILAKIMSSQSGKPALKDGIKLIRRCADNISDADTEWQGFKDVEDLEE